MPVPQAILPYPRCRGALPRRAIADPLKQWFQTEQTVVLTGMPGIGKTTCASQFVQAGPAVGFRHVLWLDADRHPFELASDLSKAMAVFGGSAVPDMTYDNCEKVLCQLLFEISHTLPGPSIVVLDNYHPTHYTQELVDSALLPEWWKVLVISKTPEGPEGYPVVRLPALTTAEAEQLMVQIAGRHRVLSAGEVHSLCSLLEGHPLAVSLYARLLASNPAISVQTLVEHLENREVSNDLATRIRINYDKVSAGESECTVLRVLQSAFLSGLGLGDVETSVLKTLSLLPDDGYTFEEIGKFTQGNETCSFRLANALQQLVEKGLLTRSGMRFVCPELIKRVVYLTFWVSADDVQHVIRVMVNAMEYDAASPLSEKISYLRICEYQLRFFLVQNETLADLYHALNDIYDTIGRHETALHFAKKELSIRSALLQPDEAKLAMTFNRLGVSLVYNREFQEAYDYLARALSIRLQIYGYTHFLTGRTLMNLGLLYASTAHFEESDSCLKEAAAILQADTTNPTYWKDVINVYNIIGDTHRLQQQYDQCLYWYRKALAIYKKGLVADPSEKHICCENLALGYLQGGNPGAARKWAYESLRLRTACLGSDHVLVGNAHYLTAVVEKLAGAGPAAEAHFRTFEKIYRTGGLEASPAYIQRLEEFGNLQ